MSLNWKDDKTDDARALITTAFVTIFVQYVLLEVFERFCGLEPQIYVAKNIGTLTKRIEERLRASNADQEKRDQSNYKSTGDDDDNNKNDDTDEIIINSDEPKSIDHDHDGTEMPFRLTRSMDSKGNYRMTVRSSIWLIKTLWLIGLLIWMIALAIIYPSYYYDYLWKMDKNVVYFLPFRCGIVYITFGYLFELCVNRYGKFGTREVLHHVMTVVVGFQGVVFDQFLPYAVWYAFWGIAMAWPVTLFALFARNIKWSYSHKRINALKKSIQFAYYHYLFDCVINVVGQFVILYRGIHTGSVQIFEIIITVLVICIWLYEDYQLLKTLKQYSLQNYQTAKLLRIKTMLSVDDLQPNTSDIDNEIKQQLDV